MSRDLYQDIYAAIRTKTIVACATVAEAMDATEELIDELVIENQRLRTETGQHRIDLEEYLRDVKSLTAERDRLKAALVRLRDCDWVIRLPDRMDAVREIAREALEAKE